jgi:hypothetical protein
MKPTAERYQAATEVNALSPERDVLVKADSVQELKGSTVHSVMASCELLYVYRGSQAAAWYRKDCVGTWESLCAPRPTGTFRECAAKQPGPLSVRYPIRDGAKNKGYRRGRRTQAEKARNRRGYKGSRTCS